MIIFGHRNVFQDSRATGAYPHRTSVRPGHKTPSAFIIHAGLWKKVLVCVLRHGQTRRGAPPGVWARAWPLDAPRLGPLGAPPQLFSTLIGAIFDLCLRASLPRHPYPPRRRSLASCTPLGAHPGLSPRVCPSLDPSLSASRRTSRPLRRPILFLWTRLSVSRRTSPSLDAPLCLSTHLSVARRAFLSAPRPAAWPVNAHLLCLLTLLTSLKS